MPNQPDVSTRHADAVLEMLGTDQAAGATCSVLTPALKANLKKLEPGQVLLVRINDPSARLDVRAWCALTGNDLIDTVEESDGTLNFYIRRKQNG